MIEVPLAGLGKDVEEGTVQNWFFEEGDAIAEGDELVELATEEGVITIQSPVAGILAEVYYDEGEMVNKGEILCTIDDEAGAGEPGDKENGER